MVENENRIQEQRSDDSKTGAPVNESSIVRSVNSGVVFRLTPNATLVMLVFVAAAFGLLTAQFETITRVPFVLMVGFFILMVWFRSALALSCLFLILGWFVVVKRFRISPWFQYDQNVILASDLMFSLFVMAFAAACFRYLETRKYCLGVLSKFGWGAGAVKTKHANREFPSLLGGRWWLIPVSIAASFVLLGTYPLDTAAVQKYWIKPAPARLIVLFGVLFLAWFLIRSIFSLVMRWKMDEDQAAVHVRSVYAKEFWREHQAIESRRAKAISKGS